jgi:hypothetical protein
MLSALTIEVGFEEDYRLRPPPEGIFMKSRLMLLFALALCLASGTASTAGAAAPTTDVIPIDYSFTPPQLSGACGFAVTRHVEGTLTIRTFYANDGSFVRELDQYQLVETLSANGHTLVGRTIQNIQVVLLSDGSYTVAFTGTDFRVAVPGAGISFGSVGRTVLLFAADNTLLDIKLDVGNFQGTFAALCTALSA